MICMLYAKLQNTEKAMQMPKLWEQTCHDNCNESFKALPIIINFYTLDKLWIVELELVIDHTKSVLTVLSTSC